MFAQAGRDLVAGSGGIGPKKAVDRRTGPPPLDLRWRPTATHRLDRPRG